MTTKNKTTKTSKSTKRAAKAAKPKDGILHLMHGLLKKGPVSFKALERTARSAGLSIRDRKAFKKRGERGFLSCYAKVLTRKTCPKTLRLTGKVVMDGDVAVLKRAA